MKKSFLIAVISLIIAIILAVFAIQNISEFAEASKDAKDLISIRSWVSNTITNGEKLNYTIPDFPSDLIDTLQKYNLWNVPYDISEFSLRSVSKELSKAQDMMDGAIAPMIIFSALAIFFFVLLLLNINGAISYLKSIKSLPKDERNKSFISFGIIMTKLSKVLTAILIAADFVLLIIYYESLHVGGLFLIIILIVRAITIATIIFMTPFKGKKARVIENVNVDPQIEELLRQIESGAIQIREKQNTAKDVVRIIAIICFVASCAFVLFSTPLFFLSILSTYVLDLVYIGMTGSTIPASFQ